MKLVKFPTGTVGVSKLPLVIALAAWATEAVIRRQLPIMARLRFRFMLNIGSSRNGK
jgi:hypothetical protein